MVDEIVVATDSAEIERVVNVAGCSKVRLYRRSAENATDSSTTESVMLEYLNSANYSSDTIFMLVQATSPLTQSHHFSEALERYAQGGYDSMLSCVRSFRFFWAEDGTSKNYDYRSRPRKQDFAGELMENGAFYINTIEGVTASQNRLSGSIGIYEMPEYTATEIDEPDDWTIIESLVHRYISPKNHTDIKLFLSDVDGVLTDGGMYYAQSGEESKRFNTRDGMGLQLLQQVGIKTGIITSEDTTIVENRVRKLKLDYLRQGCCHGGKLAAAQEICQREGVTLHQTAYIGDDVNCFELLSAVGMAACPADAVEKIKSIPNILIMSKRGGEGCVREFAEMILANS